MTTALHRLRLARGQSLRQLAADVGCSYETIRRIEHGCSTDARPSTRVALERVLGVPFDVLTAPLNTNGGAPRNAAASLTTAEKSEAPYGD
jgi:transcriptional regulator with XRE-family HTH domain